MLTYLRGNFWQSAFNTYVHVRTFVSAEQQIQSTTAVKVYRHSSDEPSEETPGKSKQTTAPPTDFHLVWRSVGRNPVCFWAPIPQPGYAAIGALATLSLDPPSTRDVLCVANEETQPAAVFDSPAWQWEPPAVRRPPLPAVLLHVLPCLRPFCALCGQVHVWQYSKIIRVPDVPLICMQIYLAACKTAVQVFTWFALPLCPASDAYNKALMSAG